MNKTIITIEILGGLVQDVSGLSEDCELHVHDYDEGDCSHPSWDAEKEYFVTIFEGGDVECDEPPAGAILAPQSSSAADIGSLFQEDSASDDPGTAAISEQCR
jgi:hypothetical protein